jgi:ribulose-phosphate 3-epimerase
MDFVDSLSQAGASGITFHYEAEYDDIRKLCAAIRNKNMRVGISIKPATPLDKQIKDLIRDGIVDMILVMTVEPGFGGQKFMANMMPKVK